MRLARAGVGTVGGGALIPLSEKTFGSPFGQVEFVTNDRGVATHLLIRVAEGDLVARRLPDAR